MNKIKVRGVGQSHGTYWFDHKEYEAMLAHKKLTESLFWRHLSKGNLSFKSKITCEEFYYAYVFIEGFKTMVKISTLTTIAFELDKNREIVMSIFHLPGEYQFLRWCTLNDM